jgi:hypothetical protein
MNYRNSTPEEINLIATFLTNEFGKTEEAFSGRIPSDDESIESFKLAQSYFYSTLETPFGYKIITSLCFYKCQEKNEYDIFQERFIVFKKNNKVQSISECDWLSANETDESLTKGKSESKF